MSILVGPSGLEPPTSCLSGTRSNLLSYEPMWLVSVDSFTLERFLWNLHFHEVKISLWLCQNFTRRRRISLWRSQNFTAKPLALLGGDDGIRTHDPLLAGQVLSQLSYTPMGWISYLLGFRGEFCFSPVSALSYLPVQSPVKYFHHCRA